MLFMDINTWVTDSINKSKIYAIIGSRGSGKSCFAYEFMDWHQTQDRKLYTYKFPKKHLLPKHIINVDCITKCEKNGVLLIDERGIEFNQFSFNSKNSIELVNMLKIARHRGLSIIFIAQNGANLTRDVRRLVDCYLLKNPSFTQLYDEISIIKRLYQNCFMLFTTEEQKQKGFYVSEIGELGYSDVPSWWTEDISKAYDGEKETSNISKLFKKQKV